MEVGDSSDSENFRTPRENDFSNGDLSSTMVSRLEVEMAMANLPRFPKDAFWLFLWLAHFGAAAYVLILLGKNRWDNNHDIRDYWSMFGIGIGLGTAISWLWLWLLRNHPNVTIKVAVNAPCTFLAVLCVFSFWYHAYVTGAVLAGGALLQFLYAISAMDRLAFTMLLVRKAIGFVDNFPSLLFISYAAVLVLDVYLVGWTFGIAGVLRYSEDGVDSIQWLLVLVLCLSLFWTGSVFVDVVQVTVGGTLMKWLLSGREGSSPLARNVSLQTLKQTVLYCIGSICYGSLFSPAIKTLRWIIKGINSRCQGNECMVCCVGVIFELLEPLVRFCNKYGFVTLSVYGKSFTQSSKYAWELFQSKGVESLVVYDLTGAVFFMGTVLGGLVTGSGVGLWCWYMHPKSVIMVGVTAFIMGVMIVGNTLVVVSSAVNSIYVAYAEDPALIGQIDAEFAAQIVEAHTNRLQQRSGKAVHSNIARGLTGPGGLSAGLELPM